MPQGLLDPGAARPKAATGWRGGVADEQVDGETGGGAVRESVPEGRLVLEGWGCGRAWRCVLTQGPRPGST
ncbi:hypothetical protein O1L60_08765 [Streptomyces diastatochromogenes]|nr:hypothetical protein [Streptomyces diastatochromogenes]